MEMILQPTSWRIFLFRRTNLSVVALKFLEIICSMLEPKHISMSLLRYSLFIIQNFISSCFAKAIYNRRSFINFQVIGEKIFYIIQITLLHYQISIYITLSRFFTFALKFLEIICSMLEPKHISMSLLRYSLFIIQNFISSCFAKAIYNRRSFINFQVIGEKIFYII